MQVLHISIEALKSAGSLHAHGHTNIACLHQQVPLSEIMRRLAGDKRDLVEQYLRFKQHVCREGYEDVETWCAEQTKVEDVWPEYKESVNLVR